MKSEQLSHRERRRRRDDRVIQFMFSIDDPSEVEYSVKCNKKRDVEIGHFLDKSD